LWCLPDDDRDDEEEDGDVQGVDHLGRDEGRKGGMEGGRTRVGFKRGGKEERREALTLIFWMDGPNIGPTIVARPMDMPGEGEREGGREGGRERVQIRKS